MLNFKPAFSLSFFTLIKKLFSFSLLSAIRMAASASLRWLIFPQQCPQHSGCCMETQCSQWASLVALPVSARDSGLTPGSGRSPGEMAVFWKWQSTLVFLPGQSHEQSSLVGYSSEDLRRAGHDSATKQQMLISTVPSW